MRFVDVTNDIAFHRIFGNENKTKTLISFLNATLKLEGNHRIIEAVIANPYQFPRIAGEKASIIDVRAKDEKGRQFVVEMQVADVRGFAKRVQYYTCRDYSMQIDRGEKYYELNPTYFIGILGFDFFKGEDYLSNHIILDEVTYEHKLDDIKFTFIELNKFNIKINNLKTLIEKWVFFIKNAENLRFIPDHVDDEGLLEAYKDADKHSWDKEALIAYDNFFIAQQDAIGRVEIAVEKAVEKAVKKAVAETEKQTAERVNLKVIKKCLVKNMSIEDIADIMELSKEEVSDLIQQINKEQ